MTLSNEVECDEAYVVAGHKGQPEVVKKKGRQGRRRRLQGKCGRGTLKKESPPVCGMMQRSGQVVINLLANVTHKTIEPFIKDMIIPGTRVYTDGYSIYARLHAWGYKHKHVNHGRGEYARDEDGDGFCEVHVNTMEGFWSLLRSWLRPHRGISQEKLPFYLGFFDLCTTSESEAKRCLVRSLSSWSHKTLESNMSDFCLPHAALRQPLPQPLLTNGTGSAKRWQPWTPAMAAELTDHVWTLREVLMFRVPPWPQPQAV